MLKAVSSESKSSVDDDNDIPVQSVSMDIWDKKYRLKTKKGEFVDEDIQDTYDRVAKALAEVEDPKIRDEWHEKFLWALKHGAIQIGRAHV